MSIVRGRLKAAGIDMLHGFPIGFDSGITIEASESTADMEAVFHPASLAWIRPGLSPAQRSKTVQVTVLVRPNATSTSHQHQPTEGATEELVRITEELGVRLEPMHPAVRDPRLALYFTVEVPDRSTAERVIQQLQRSSAVEAAYLKPADELP